MSKDEKEKIGPFNATVSSDTACGRYTNVTNVNHQDNDFRLDMGVRQGEENLMIHTRVFMTPYHAKQILVVLNQNIQAYEAKFGEIRGVTQREQVPAGSQDGQVGGGSTSDLN